MSFWRAVAAVAGKDLRADFRTREIMSSMLIFALLVIVVFSVAFDPSREEARAVLPGVMWVAFFFAGVLGLNRSFVGEKTNDALHGLLLAPVDRSVIYFGKALANFIFMAIVEAISLPVFMVLFDTGAPSSWTALVAILVMGTFGFAAVGTFLAALTANTRASEVLLPILLFPVAIPVALASVEITRALFEQGMAVELANWWRITGVYDVVFLVTPFLLFDYLLEG